MPMILGVDHMRDEPLSRQSTPDQSLGSSVLEDDPVTNAAGLFGEDAAPYFELCRLGKLTAGSTRIRITELKPNG
jgi:hypothetical protein